MTEAEYLSSTDPAAMRTAIADHGLWVERKCRAFVEAWEYTEAAVNFPQKIDYRLSSWRGARGKTWAIDADWCIRNLPVVKMTREVCANLIRDIWGKPWRGKKCVSCGGAGYSYRKYSGRGIEEPTCLTCSGSGIIASSWPYPEINPDWLTYRNGLVPALAKAAVTRECECDGGYVSFPEMDGVTTQSCGRCHGRGAIPITGPIDPLRLAVLADALEEAGCTDDGILGHLRATETIPASRKCRKCSGYYRPLKKDTLPLLAVCDTCHDDGGFWDHASSGAVAGTRPVSHIWTPSGGCWVIQSVVDATREALACHHGQ